MRKDSPFSLPEDTSLSDVFIPPNELNTAMNGDIVMVRLNSQSSGSRQEGTVIRILERAIQRVVGTYTETRNFGFVIPDDKKITSDIFIPKNGKNGVMEGHKVVVKLTSYPEGRMNAEGEVETILGCTKTTRALIFYRSFISTACRENFQLTRWNRHQVRLTRLMKKI